MSRSPRCAETARDVDLDPRGTAPSSPGFLLVELPMSWPAQLRDDDRLSGVHEVLDRLADDGSPYRLQLVLGQRLPGDSLTLIAYVRPAGPFRGFSRRRAVADGVDHLGEAAERLLAEPNLEPPPEVLGAESRVRDLLICTHGSRDVCCGSDGTRLFQQLAGHTDPDVAIWRTTHLGGHRFAPTALSFPDGQSWAFMDEGRIRAVLERGSIDDLVDNYRGSSGFSDPALQCLEAYAFSEFGWRWLGAVRRGHREAEDVHGDVQAELTYTWPEGGGGVFKGVIRLGHEVSIPACRSLTGVGTVDRPPVLLAKSHQTSAERGPS